MISEQMTKCAKIFRIFLKNVLTKVYRHCYYIDR